MLQTFLLQSRILMDSVGLCTIYASSAVVYSASCTNAINPLYTRNTWYLTVPGWLFSKCCDDFAAVFKCVATWDDKRIS